ncbi:MAG: aminodeoxychorismate synthase component I [Pirellulales bacterium]
MSPYTRHSLCSELPTARWHLLETVELERPFWLYFSLFVRQPYAFLLDSALEADSLGRYSLMGADPFLVVRVKRHPSKQFDAAAAVEIVRSWPQRHREDYKVPGGEVFAYLRALMEEYRLDQRHFEDRPLPLLSGAVGYFGYEAGHFVEDLPDTGHDDLGLPDIQLMFCHHVLGHCHQSGKTYLSVVGCGDSEPSARRQAESIRDDLLRRLRQFEVTSGPPQQRPDPRFSSSDIEIKQHFDEVRYCQAVDQIKQHIFAGDIYQACMTHRLESPLYGDDPWALYQELRTSNPAPFASYLKCEDVDVISASPERFLSLDIERNVESRPIKGTRRRSASPEADFALRDELQNSAKDRAENVMIVDLVRNDFGRVCEFNSVSVPKLMTIERYATVFQLVSTIRGKLGEDVHPVDLLRACFPGGSMTGAPKIAAMKILDQLEPVNRGIYSGAIGYLDFAGPIDLSIVIRTFVVKDGRCYYNVGGAVVADSDARAEYLETMDKARALMQALAVRANCAQSANSESAMAES